MNKLAVTAISMTLAASVPALGDDDKKRFGAVPVTMADVQAVSPALAKYTQSVIFDDLWMRPGLSPRDRSVITVAALIARNQPVEMPYHFNLALDNGVKPAELSEIITHLAFYSGWGNATGAVAVAAQVFAARGIGADQLPEASPAPLPLDETADAERAKRVEQNVGPVSQGVVEYTNGVLFKDLWLRPGLAPRDRSLITVTALVASGQVAQTPYHLDRAMSAGLTQDQASEILTHLTFYAGWPNVMSAVPVFKDVFEKRQS
ncbi:4-carboxymuconolactone decarboxylase [Rhizobium sp. PP-F2F-G48]|uniref:carboxymuconolactone decarboxylase family protein n=1 Tax=Rhizobium sp. PP-F2F-G48 TaxID=2135651 RepID=UPI00104F42C7|nr:carboxymuconolactone decarboxylase family protein [Rhizobium sp. PP-F2F-G48]TCM46340.1 4-carboxymuconolactone decarboxylase [Rhizobium sp. PP-F2F-G48]